MTPNSNGQGDGRQQISESLKKKKANNLKISLICMAMFPINK